MARWFRMHESTLDDPKVQQRLSDSQFRAWVNILCLACRHDGVLPPLAEIAFALRRSEKDTAKVIFELVKVGLIDETETGMEPHNWNGRQYKSDVSNERVKRHRQRSRNVTPTVTETPSETETEAETEQSVAKATQPARRSPDDERIKLPADWQPSIDGADYARDKGLDPATTGDAFTDYFTQGRGRNEKRTRAGWERRWRVWCNTDAERRPARVSGLRPAASGGDAGAFARAAARLGNG